MSEVEKKTSFKFDKVLPHGGGIQVPETVIENIPRINNLPPDGWAFVAHGSVLRDTSTGELVIDTADRIPEQPQTLAELETRPAVLHTFRAIGERALDGYIVDYRRMKVFARSDRGLEHGIASAEHQEYRNNPVLLTRLPLGVIFAVYDEIHYYGDDKLIDHAEHLVAIVDERVRSMTDAQQLLERKNNQQDYQQVVIE